MATISALYIYPIKSLGGICVKEARLTDRGLEHDRRWMLIDDENRFLTQRENPEMALLQTEFADEGIRVFHKHNTSDAVMIPFNSSTHGNARVIVWDDVCDAEVLNDELNNWFSRHLKLSCRLVFMPDSSLRKVDELYALHREDITSFSDGYPLLIISEASLDDLNSRLMEALPMNRFRPNIVLGNTEAFEEDRMQHFIINEVDFYGVKLCARCVITTTNQETMDRGKEPLKTLSGYRMKNNKVYFGQNVLYKGTTILKTGDPVKIIARFPEPIFL